MDEDLAARCLAIAAETEAEYGRHDRRMADFISRMGRTDQRPKPGDLAPRFAIPEAGGKLTALDELIGENGVVLVFVHGLWCPYCNAQLGAFGAAETRLSAAGLRLATITPEVGGRAAITKEELGLSGAVLCDVDEGVALRYGCLLPIPIEDRDFMTSREIDLGILYGNAGWFMPLASTFLIDRSLRVAAVYGDADQRVRPGPEQVLDEASRLLGQP